MRARDVIGRRIVAVRQRRVGTREGYPDPDKLTEYVWALDEIELDDGSLLTFSTIETDFGDYEIRVGRRKP